MKRDRKKKGKKEPERRRRVPPKRKGNRPNPPCPPICKLLLALFASTGANNSPVVQKASG